MEKILLTQELIIPLHTKVVDIRLIKALTNQQSRILLPLERHQTDSDSSTVT